MTPRPEALPRSKDQNPSGDRLDAQPLHIAQQDQTRDRVLRQRLVDGSSITLEQNGVTLTNPNGESLTISGQNSADRAKIDKFTLIENGNRINGAAKDDGSWLIDPPDVRWQNLKNIRPSEDGRSVAFEKKDLTTDHWQLDGTKYTTDAKLAPTYFTGSDGRTTSTPAVSKAIAPDGMTTNFHYQEVGAPAPYSQLSGYAVRDSAGNLKEIGVRNVDSASKSHWITFRPNPGEAGLLADMSPEGQKELIAKVERLANDPTAQGRLPQELAQRAVEDPYQQVASSAVDAKGHLFQTLHNGTTVTRGDDGRTYSRTADGLLSASEIDAGGNRQLLLAESRLPNQGLLSDRFSHDQDGRMTSVKEEAKDSSGKTFFSREYQLKDGHWLTRDQADPEKWTAAGVDIKTFADGRVAIEALNEQGQGGKDSKSVRMIFPSGGQTLFERQGDGRLAMTDMIGATGDNTAFAYTPEGHLKSIEQISAAKEDGARTRSTYKQAPNGQWQRVVNGREGKTTEDLGRLISIDEGGVSFEKARLDHRGDFISGKSAKPHEEPAPSSDKRRSPLIEAETPNSGSDESGLRRPSWLKELAESGNARTIEASYALKSIQGEVGQGSPVQGNFALYKSQARVSFTPQSISDASAMNYYARKENMGPEDKKTKGYWS